MDRSYKVNIGLAIDLNFPMNGSLVTVKHLKYALIEFFL